MNAIEGSIENTLVAYPAKVRQYVADTSVSDTAPVLTRATGASR